MPHAPGLEFGKVLDKRPGRAHEQAIARLEAEAVERVQPVVATELGGGDALVEEPVVAEGEREGALRPLVPETGTELLLERERSDDLGGGEAAEFQAERTLAHGLDDELARRQIDRSEPDLPGRPGGEEGEVVVPARVEEGVLEDSPRRHRLDDLAPDDPLGAALRLLDLVADRRLPPEPDQAGQVLLERLRRNAGEGDAGRGPIVPGGEGEAEEARALLGVLPEELIEISHAEEEEGVRVATLHLPPLAHERGLPTTPGACPSGHGATRPPGSTRRSGR